MEKIIRMNNFKLLCDIMDKEEGVIYCTSTIDINDEKFNEPIK